ncbi:S-adenosyl-L-methionine-dependent methyltransferase [Aspergillus heteromorphus CBS 117.55]|uniref:S-adenosyl-L-methionine-dependent methyltransferase n=1 Tax=Aspergillus heteromorphus CBS 117.55 TaxID=1448321 RepID=A0A317VF39_9EURO|nr:S-adenosyl-L-methionine-dependent methyltransferase [Aspergillus heteromorphus CBS 117.55]PWY72984.1 S-adenosyl-L-methionine-dependent methyltransferase [Aspergillus heteromorphus CBS 117.55]
MTISLPNPASASSEEVKPTKKILCYGSPYLAEFYDIWIGLWDDTAFYSECLSQIASHTPPSEPVVVLDIGAGTGRITHALASNLPQHIANVRLLGLDMERHMLERAATLTDPAHADKISWVLGSACDLESVPAFRDEGLRADMMVFACGSICHLNVPGQAEQLFRGIASVLRPKTGKAYISVLKGGSSDNGVPDQMMTKPPPAEFRSRDFKDIIYRDTTTVLEVVDDIWHNTRHIVVSRVLEDGSERVVEDNIAEVKAKIWTEGELRRIAKAAGLRVVDIVDRHNDCRDELIFVFEVDV